MAAIAPARRPLVRALQLLPDRRLARLAAEGDPHAFAAIYERHHRALYRYCLSILHDPDDAGDALQNAMVAALKALSGGVQVLALKPWLFRIAHNESISLARRTAPESSVADVPERAAAGEDPATRERLRQLVADLTGLPERQRGALVMRELCGLGYDEIGGALNCSGPAARQAVFEARTALHELAAGRDMDCSDVRELISAADGRLLRARRVRSHLGDCGDCRDFQAALATRRRDLALLFPPPAAITAALAMKAALGGATGGGVIAAFGGGGGGGIAAALTGAGVGGQVAAKALAVVALAAGAGAGALELAAEEAQRPQREREQTAQAPGPETSHAARNGEGTGESGRTDAARSLDASDREPRRHAERRAGGDADVRAERRRERESDSGDEERQDTPELDAPRPDPGAAPVPVSAPPAAPSPPRVPVSNPGGGQGPGYSSDSVSLLPDRIEVNHGDNHVSVGPDGVNVSGDGGSVSVGPNGVTITIGGQTLTLGAPGTR